MSIIIDSGSYEQYRQNMVLSNIIDQIISKCEQIDDISNYLNNCKITDLKFEYLNNDIPTNKPIFEALTNTVPITNLIESINETYKNYGIEDLCIEIDNEYSDSMGMNNIIEIGDKILETKQRLYDTVIKTGERIIQEICNSRKRKRE